MHSREFVHGGSLYISTAIVFEANRNLDVHFRNILVKAPPNLNSLSIDEFYREYGAPDLTPIEHRDGKALPINIPPMAVTPICIGRKTAEQFTLADAKILLTDFGEAFAPTYHPRQAKDSHIPLGMRPPKARFEPLGPLSYAADIWSLGLLIWQILGLKPLFTTEFPDLDELISQFVDVLRPGSDGIAGGINGMAAICFLTNIGDQFQIEKFGHPLRMNLTTRCSIGATRIKWSSLSMTRDARF